MLGKSIKDPDGVEGEPGESPGLGLLDIETTLHHEKVLCHSKGIWNFYNEKLEGYEIHNGITTQDSGLSSAVKVTSRNNALLSDRDGAMTADGKIWGTYFHGLFDLPGFRYAFLQHLQPGYESTSAAETVESYRDKQYSLLADHFRSHLDMSKLLNIMNIKEDKPLTV